MLIVIRVAVANFFAHETSVIDQGASVGKGSKIWHFSHVCSGAKIGERVVIGQNVYVAQSAVIGFGCKIQNNVSIYDNVTLEENVFCGPSCVFTNVYNPRAFVERKHEYRDTLVKCGATLGANCTVVCGVTIGDYAMIGAGAVVNKNVPNFALVVGVPAKIIGWISEKGDKLKLPISGTGKASCRIDGSEYILVGGCVRKDS